MHDLPTGNKASPEKILWFFLASVMVCISVLRGTRYPNIWSYTHFLFNYEFEDYTLKSFTFAERQKYISKFTNGQGKFPPIPPRY